MQRARRVKVQQTGESGNRARTRLIWRALRGALKGGVDAAHAKVPSDEVRKMNRPWLGYDDAE